MTKDEIMQLEGLELDIAVAEKVMGYEPGTATLGGWHPSTDISAAWEVVEELQSSHLYVDIRTCADFYEVWITRWETQQVTSTVAYPKLPEAICKAALLAVMEVES